MSYYLWIILNILVIIVSSLYIWLFQENDSVTIVTGQVLAQLAFILFLVNINMYFIFLVIRKSKVRKIKIALSKFSRKMMKAHIPIALVAASLIILHGGIMMIELGVVIGYGNPKFITGYIGILLLSFTMFAGYLRHKKSSGFRRKFHLVIAFVFTTAVLVHLFLPL